MTLAEEHSDSATSGALRGRVALVTGAAGADIGQAIVRRLAANGASVAVTDRHTGRLAQVTDSLKALYGDRVMGTPLDLLDYESIQAAVDATSRTLGPVDILVNNAAVTKFGELDVLDIEEWREVMEVDLTAPWLLTRLVSPGMKQKREGVVINISSTGAYDVGKFNEGAYCAAKAALHSLTRSFATELGAYGIRCNAVAPGMVRSKFLEKHADLYAGERPVLPELPQPSDVAACVAFLASDEARCITGEIVHVTSGWYMRA